MSNPSNYLEDRLGALRLDRGAPGISHTYSQNVQPSHNVVRSTVNPIPIQSTVVQPSSVSYVRQPMASHTGVSFGNNSHSSALNAQSHLTPNFTSTPNLAHGTHTGTHMVNSGTYNAHPSSTIIRQPVSTENLTHNSQFLGARSEYAGARSEFGGTHSSYVQPQRSVHVEPKFTTGLGGHTSHENPQLREMQSRIHKEIDDKLKLELEKKELEVMLDNEHKRQEDITRYYDEEKRVIKDENWNLEQKLNTLERDLEQKTSSAKELEQKVSQANSDNQNFQKENFNLKEELKRLGEMTNLKVRELDDKLSQNINIIENEKTQYKREIENKKMQNADKVKRMEEEYNRRLSEWQIKLQKANETSIKYDNEINFLKEKMHSLDAEARSKLESIKQRVQEEEQRKSMSILRGFENKLKATEEEKRQHERRSEQLSKEMDRLEREWENNLQPLETDNKNIKNEIDHIKQQIEFGNETARKLREDQAECDKALQKINKDITDLRNKIRFSEDENSTKIRNMVDQFRQEKYDLEKRIEDAKQRVMQKERHLEQTEQELAALRRDYQKLVDSLKNNLANTISSTLNEYKGRHAQPNQYNY